MSLDAVLALGVTPVGAVGSDPTSGLLDYVADRTADVEIVGTIGEPDLEQIAVLQSDLILSTVMRHEEIYTQLSQIAPTAFGERTGVAWKDVLALAGEALGIPEEADRVLAAGRTVVRSFSVVVAQRQQIVAGRGAALSGVSEAA